MIEKLEDVIIIERYGGKVCSPPDNRMIADKINEIIDYLNKQEVNNDNNRTDD